MTHLSDSALLQYATGELTGDRSGVAEHLAGCGACRGIVLDTRRIGADLRDLPVPPAPSLDALLRIPRVRPRTVWPQAIAAVLVIGIAGALIANTPGAIATMSLWPEPPHEPGPPVTAILPNRIAAGRWTYMSRMYTDSILWSTPVMFTVTVDSAAVGPTPAWRVVESGARGSDTTIVARGDLRPMSGVLSDPGSGLRVVTTYSRDSVITIDSAPRYRYADGHRGLKVRRHAFAMADTVRVRAVNEAGLWALMRTLPLERSWRGTIAMVEDPAWSHGAVIRQLAVEGRHTIVTPIGRCDCWQVSVSHGGVTGISAQPRSVQPTMDLATRSVAEILWVRASDRIVVKTESVGEDVGVVELVAEDPPPT